MLWACWAEACFAGVGASLPHQQANGVIMGVIMFQKSVKASIPPAHWLPDGQSALATLNAGSGGASNSLASKQSVADPCVLHVDRVYYVYGTGGTLLKSPNLKAWKRTGWKHFKRRPRWWAPNPGLWAPEVHRIGNKYVLYYSARDRRRKNGKGDFYFSIGIATATAPSGRFQDHRKRTVRPKKGRYSVIDPSFFRDPGSGRQYLLWKDNRIGRRRRRIMIQRLSKSGLRRVSRPISILRIHLPWEGNSVEAPTLIYRHGWYYLFYSGNGYKFHEHYAVGVARSRRIKGPYKKKRRPILKGHGRFVSPGHQFVLKEGNTYRFFYHAYDRNEGNKSARYLVKAVMSWVRGWPRVRNRKFTP
jgi:arabinan endo-1,5-alpha-L-arabinosidase